MWNGVVAANERAEIVATTFSMMTTVWGSKELRHNTWRGFEAHLSYLMAAFNILVQWDGLEPDENGRIHRSIAQFVLLEPVYAF